MIINMYYLTAALMSAYFATGAACNILDAVAKRIRNKAYKKELKDKGLLD